MLPLSPNLMLYADAAYTFKLSREGNTLQGACNNNKCSDTRSNLILFTQ
jgi:hypothetical protein